MAENVQLRAIRSFYSLRSGLVTLSDDVLSIVGQVRELYGDRVTIELDPETYQYLFIEHGEDGTDRLIFATDELDPRALERLQRADSQLRGYEDPYLAAEREQDAIHKAQEEAGRARLREEGERLATALKKDGVMPRLPLKTSLYIPNPRRARA